MKTSLFLKEIQFVRQLFERNMRQQWSELSIVMVHPSWTSALLECNFCKVALLQTRTTSLVNLVQFSRIDVIISSFKSCECGSCWIIVSSLVVLWVLSGNQNRCPNNPKILIWLNLYLCSPNWAHQVVIRPIFWNKAIYAATTIRAYHCKCMLRSLHHWMWLIGVSNVKTPVYGCPGERCGANPQINQCLALPNDTNYCWQIVTKRNRLEFLHTVHSVCKCIPRWVYCFSTLTLLSADSFGSVA